MFTNPVFKVRLRIFLVIYIYFSCADVIGFHKSTNSSRKWQLFKENIKSRNRNWRPWVFCPFHFCCSTYKKVNYISIVNNSTENVCILTLEHRFPLEVMKKHLQRDFCIVIQFKFSDLASRARVDLLSDGTPFLIV